MKRPIEFKWEALDVIIRGKSSIDASHGFSIHTQQDADAFLKSYGFDFANPIEQAECFGHFHEALNFIRKCFLFPDNSAGLKIEIPRKILELTDVKDLFLMSSFAYPTQNKDGQGTYLRNWACSLLKVMHTIAHIDQDLRSNYFAEIQKQILDRFYRQIQRDENGVMYLGSGADDGDKVNLIAFETKPKKSRDSILLKLLHKPENVAEDIFDRVGIRFVTPKPLDSLLVIQYLTQKMIVMPPNNKPSRSRNTLIDLDYFRNEAEILSQSLEEKRINYDEYLLMLNQVASPPSVDPNNPHSSEFYRSIQFTCRQLIKLKNPLFDDIKELKQQFKSKNLTEDTAKIVERIDMKFVQKELKFFYPYEVQVVDIKNHEENEKGRSAHSEYKKLQIQTAMKRVMGSLADAQRV